VRRTLTLTPAALADLDGTAARLIQPGAGIVAWRRWQAILRGVACLRLAPCLYPLGNHPGIREAPLAAGYRALYRVIPDTGRSTTAGDVTVLRVFGPEQEGERPIPPLRAPVPAIPRRMDR
jgi:plasmid stabilization system protein ParE